VTTKLTAGRRAALLLSLCAFPLAVAALGETGYVGSLRALTFLHVYGWALAVTAAAWFLRSVWRKRPLAVTLPLLALMCVGATSAGVNYVMFTPRCSGADDAAEFAAILTTLGSETGSIRMPWVSGARCAVGNVTVPSNVALDFSNSTGLKVNTGSTLVVKGDMLGPAGQQRFYNATAGLGTVSFSGNTALKVADPVWWGAKPDVVAGFDGAVSASGTTLTSPAAAFTSSLAGKSLTIINPSGANHHATVSAVTNSTHLTFTPAVSFTGSGLRYAAGTGLAPPLKAALAAAGTGHVSRVRLGRGSYLMLAGTVDIPQGVSLEGEWFDKWSNHIGGFPNTQNTCTGDQYAPSDVNNYLAGDTTTLVVDADEGSTTGYLLKTGNHAAVKGVGFWYIGELSQLATPKSYPWTIDLNGYWSEAGYIELGLAYQGIRVHDGDVANVHHITGQPISVGLYAHRLYNHPVFEKIHFIPQLGYLADCAVPTSLSPLGLWITAHGTGFKFGRVDAAELSSFEVWGYNTGIQLLANAESEGLHGPWMTIHDGIIESIHPVIVEDTQPVVSGQGAGVTIRHVNMGSYSLLWPGGMPAGNTPTGLLIYPTFGGNLRLEDSEVAVETVGGAGYAVWFQQGTGSLWLTNNLIKGTLGAKPLVLEGPTSGSALGTAYVIGNRVEQTGTKAVYLSGRMAAQFSTNRYNTPYTNTFDTAGPPALVTSNSPVSLASQSCNDFFTDNATVCGLVSTGGLSIGQIVLDFNTKKLKMPGVACSDLGTPANNQMAYCGDCQETSDPCACGGTGSYAKGLNGRWVCRP
jgi:hypothetical protein